MTKQPFYAKMRNYKNLSKLLNQKFILKLIALMLAIITWLYVHEEIRKRPSVMTIDRSQNNNF